MFEEKNQQNIMNDSLKLSLEKENEFINKCKKYNKNNADETITDLINSFIDSSQKNIEKMSELITKLSLDHSINKNIKFTQLDKLQILLDDKVYLQQLYNKLSIKNMNPEIRKMFILFRDSNAEDIYHLQQKITQLVNVEKPISKSV